MTPERARHIIDCPRFFGQLRYRFPTRPNGDNRIHADGITWDETEAINRLWSTMPGTCCYFDALKAIAGGATIPPAID